MCPRFQGNPGGPLRLVGHSVLLSGSRCVAGVCPGIARVLMEGADVAGGLPAVGGEGDYPVRAGVPRIPADTPGYGATSDQNTSTSKSPAGAGSPEISQQGPARPYPLALLHP